MHIYRHVHVKMHTPMHTHSCKNTYTNITCHLADAFLQSNLQLIRLSRRHTPWSNVGLRALLKGPTAVQILSWPNQGSKHRPCGSKSSSLTTTLQATLQDANTSLCHNICKYLSTYMHLHTMPAYSYSYSNIQKHPNLQTLSHIYAHTLYTPILLIGRFTIKISGGGAFGSEE